MLSLFAFQYQCSKHSKNWLKTWLQWLQVYGSVQPVCSGFMHSTYENRMSQSCLDQELETTKHNRSLFHLSFFTEKTAKFSVWESERNKREERNYCLPDCYFMDTVSHTWLCYSKAICTSEPFAVLISFPSLYAASY